MIHRTSNLPCSVVTGGTAGIGAAVAESLARAGHRVVIVGRSVDEGQSAAESLSRKHATEVTFLRADLSSQADIALLADRLGAKHKAIDVLVNCAAGVFEERRMSVDGIEYTLALNHLGTLATTLALEHLLRSSGRGRVVNLSADPRLLARQPPDPDDLEMKRGYSGIKAYMRSKNLNVITTYRLARRFENAAITVNTCHPGIVRTGLANNLSATVRLMTWLAGPFLLSPAEGADTAVWLATSDAVTSESGQLFIKRRSVPSAPCTYDRALSDRVWEQSMTLLRRTGVKA